jgi:hypothetical protein
MCDWYKYKRADIFIRSVVQDARLANAVDVLAEHLKVVNRLIGRKELQALNPRRTIGIKEPLPSIEVA